MLTCLGVHDKDPLIYTSVASFDNHCTKKNSIATLHRRSISSRILTRRNHCLLWHVTQTCCTPTYLRHVSPPHITRPRGDLSLVSAQVRWHRLLIKHHTINMCGKWRYSSTHSQPQHCTIEWWASCPGCSARAKYDPQVYTGQETG
jgi:hypothetical protein